jgi:hypothetical protein
MNTKPETERGAASFVCELRDGRIEIRHGECGTVLRSLDNAPEGTWDAIFAAFDKLGIAE